MIHNYTFLLKIFIVIKYANAIMGTIESSPEVLEIEED